MTVKAIPEGFHSLTSSLSILILMDEVPEMKAFSPLSIGGGTSAGLVMYAEDVHAVFKKAVTAGAKVTMPLEDAFWGDRSGSIVDPFGHRWMISKHIKDMSDEELEKAMMTMFTKNL